MFMWYPLNNISYSVYKVWLIKKKLSLELKLMRGLRKMAQYHFIPISWGFPSGSAGKESTCNAGDPGSIHGLGRSPGEGNDNLLLYSCLGNSMDKEAWQATVYRVTRVRLD